MRRDSSVLPFSGLAARYARTFWRVSALLVASPVLCPVPRALRFGRTERTWRRTYSNVAGQVHLHDLESGVTEQTWGLATVTEVRVGVEGRHTEDLHKVLGSLAECSSIDSIFSDRYVDEGLEDQQ